MPEEPFSEQTEQDLGDHEAATTPRGTSFLARFRVVLFFVGVVVAECLVAYFYLPNASETAAMAEAAGDPQTDPALGPEGSRLESQVEVDLGEFSLTSFQPRSNSTIRIDFHLYGTVNGADEEEFHLALAENEHRFRDQIIVIVRSAEINDLTDAGLGLIKRKILEKTNRIVGKPLLKTVIFSDFAFIEQ